MTDPEAPCHPGTGFRVLEVFPADSPIFLEMTACYREASVRLPWLSVLTCPEAVEKRNWLWGDPRTVAVFWQSCSEDLVSPDAGWKKVLRWTESIGTRETLAGEQRVHFQTFERLGEFDLVLAQTPTAARHLESRARKVAVVPWGYSAEVLGAPNWASPKDFDVAHYGAGAGLRRAVLPVLREKLDGRLLEFTGYGLDRKAALDRARAVLHVGHSQDPAFGASRLWQAIASSACLMTERRDAWPAVPGRHYVELPAVDTEHLGPWLDAIFAALNRDDLAEMARRAHSELSTYTVDRCVLEFLVPALEALL